MGDIKNGRSGAVAGRTQRCVIEQTKRARHKSDGTMVTLPSPSPPAAATAAAAAAVAALSALAAAAPASPVATAAAAAASRGFMTGTPKVSPTSSR